MALSEEQKAKVAAFPYPLPAQHPRPDDPTDHLWYTYRCLKCAGIITKVQILRRRSAMSPNLCACGGRRVSPTNPTERDEQLQFDDLLELAYAIAEGKVAPPPPNDNPEDVAKVVSAMQTVGADEACECRDHVGDTEDL